MNNRLPAVIVAAAAFDTALLAQNVLTGVVAALVTLVALLVAFSAAMRAMLLLALLLGLLLATGVLTASAVPGVAQVAAAKDSAQRWSEEQAVALSCAYRASVGIGPSEAARRGMRPLDCPSSTPWSSP